VQKFGALLAEAARRYAKRVGSRWFVDETYVRVGKQWTYLYRAVDEAGQVVDMLLREKRDVASAKAFFEQAIKRRGVVQDEVVTDKHRAYIRAVRQHAPNADYSGSLKFRHREGRMKHHTYLLNLKAHPQQDSAVYRNGGCQGVPIRNAVRE